MTTTSAAVPGESRTKLGTPIDTMTRSPLAAYAAPQAYQYASRKAIQLSSGNA